MTLKDSNLITLIFFLLLITCPCPTHNNHPAVSQTVPSWRVSACNVHPSDALWHCGVQQGGLRGTSIPLESNFSSVVLPTVRSVFSAGVVVIVKAGRSAGVCGGGPLVGVVQVVRARGAGQGHTPDVVHCRGLLLKYSR